MILCSILKASNQPCRACLAPQYAVRTGKPTLPATDVVLMMIGFVFISCLSQQLLSKHFVNRTYERKSTLVTLSSTPNVAFVAKLRVVIPPLLTNISIGLSNKDIASFTLEGSEAKSFKSNGRTFTLAFPFPAARHIVATSSRTLFLREER